MKKPSAKQIERWNKLRSEYKSHMPQILEVMKNPRRCYKMSCFNWFEVMSPIENLAWMDMREIGLPMMPQLPVLNYFIDFAHPVKKIAIEMDGKTHDVEKDLIRDTKLYENGWKVYRIKGHECNREIELGYDIEITMSAYEVENLYKDWITTTGEGIVFAVKQVHFTKKEERATELLAYCNDGTEHIKINAYEMAKKSLNIHSLLDYKI